MANFNAHPTENRAAPGFVSNVKMPADSVKVKNTGGFKTRKIMT